MSELEPRLEVLFLVEDLASASARTRAVDVAPRLAAHGIDARVEEIASGWWARRQQFSRVPGLVVLQRKLLRGGELARLRSHARRLVLDIDDAIGERPFDSSRGTSWTRPRRFRELLRAVDLVVTGSAALRDVVRPHAPVRILPVAVELPKDVPSRGRGDGLSSEVTFLWTGSAATLGYLERIAHVFDEVGRRFPRASLVVVADRPPSAMKIATRFVLWSLASEDAELARADVGIMPLAQDPWSRGKCGLKVARYLSWGLPVISSRAGAGLELVDAPRTGLLADDEGEWLAALSALAKDPERRLAMGRNARQDAAARLSLESRVLSWAQVLRRVQGVKE